MYPFQHPDQTYPFQHPDHLKVDSVSVHESDPFAPFDCVVVTFDYVTEHEVDIVLGKGEAQQLHQLLGEVLSAKLVRGHAAAWRDSP